MENTLLNLVPASYLPEVHLSQYDVGRELKFTLKDGSSDYTVPSGAVVTVKATKPSGLGFVVNATAEGSVVTLSNTETMTNENGRFPAELSIVSGNTVIGTSNFIFNIERSPHPEGTIDGDAESLLPELTLLVERIEAAADSVDEDTQTVTEAKAEVLQAKADTLQAKADTLTARDDALQAKADAITAKESAEASAQAAEEASETAEELIGSVSTKADAIVKTASGEVASFTDGGDDLPMKSLKVNIVPKQSGSGDPSPDNVRPISGTDTVNAYLRNSNFLPINVQTTTRNGITFTVNDDGSINVNGTATATTIFTIGQYILPKTETAQAYTLKGCPNGGSNSTFYLDCRGDNNAQIIDIGSGRAFISNGQSGKNADIIVYDGVTVNNLVFYPRIVLGADTSNFQKGVSNTYPISLPQTVYGGVLDIVSGKLVIDRKLITLSFITNWGQSSLSNGVFRGYISDILAPAREAITEAIMDRRKANAWAPISASSTEQFAIDPARHVVIPMGRAFDTLEDFFAEMGNAQLCYLLATPTEIQLTPTEVKTLLGANNIWSDSGTVEVEYRADTTLAYNELLSLIASLS